MRGISSRLAHSSLASHFPVELAGTTHGRTGPAGLPGLPGDGGQFSSRRGVAWRRGRARGCRIRKQCLHHHQADIPGIAAMCAAPLPRALHEADTHPLLPILHPLFSSPTPVLFSTSVLHRVGGHGSPSLDSTFKFCLSCGHTLAPFVVCECCFVQVAGCIPPRGAARLSLQPSRRGSSRRRQTPSPAAPPQPASPMPAGGARQRRRQQRGGTAGSQTAAEFRSPPMVPMMEPAMVPMAPACLKVRAAAAAGLAVLCEKPPPPRARRHGHPDATTSPFAPSLGAGAAVAVQVRAFAPIARETCVDAAAPSPDFYRPLLVQYTGAVLAESWRSAEPPVGPARPSPAQLARATRRTNLT